MKALTGFVLDTGFYCKQKGHCGKGMTFSINPSAAKTQAMFQALAISQNGTGAGTAITGGGNNASAPAAPAAPAAAPAAPAAGGNAVMGNGAVQGGACVCAVTCSTGSFPAAAAQGLGAFGGMAGKFSSLSDFIRAHLEKQIANSLQRRLSAHGHVRTGNERYRLESGTAIHNASSIERKRTCGRTCVLIRGRKWRRKENGLDRSMAQCVVAVVESSQEIRSSSCFYSWLYNPLAFMINETNCSGEIIPLYNHVFFSLLHVEEAGFDGGQGQAGSRRRGLVSFVSIPRPFPHVIP